MTHSHVQHASLACAACFIHRWDTEMPVPATWLIHACDMTHSRVRHDSSMWATLLTHMWNMTWLIFIGNTQKPIPVMRLFDTCDIIDSYVRHDSFIYATWPIHPRDTTHPYVRHDSFMRKHGMPNPATWLIRVWYGWFICEPCLTCSHVKHMWVGHMNEPFRIWLIHMTIWPVKHRDARACEMAH